jgi:hypothetical protein
MADAGIRMFCVGWHLPRKRRRVQPTPYPLQILATLTLGFKAFPLKHVESGLHDPSWVVYRRFRIVCRMARTVDGGKVACTLVTSLQKPHQPDSRQWQFHLHIHIP